MATSRGGGQRNSETDSRPIDGVERWQEATVGGSELLIIPTNGSRKSAADGEQSSPSVVEISVIERGKITFGVTIWSC